MKNERILYFRQIVATGVIFTSAGLFLLFVDNSNIFLNAGFVPIALIIFGISLLAWTISEFLEIKLRNKAEKVVGEVTGEILYDERDRLNELKATYKTLGFLGTSLFIIIVSWVFKAVNGETSMILVVIASVFCALIYALFWRTYEKESV